MKRMFPSGRALLVLISLAFSVVLTSCEKTKDIQTFDDIFDVSGVKTLNQHLAKAQSFDDFGLIFGNVSMEASKKVEDISLGQIINHYTQALKLSATETDMLLKNDPGTYLEVINRFGSLPPQLGDLKPIFQQVASSDLKEFKIKIKDEPENFYADDYYSAVLAMQTFIREEIIAPMQEVETLPPGKKDGPSPGAYIISYKIISLNNIWDMWWTYWSDGTRIKHKGAAGSYPGPMP